MAAYIVLVAALGSIDIGLAILSTAGPAAIVGGTALVLVPFVMPFVFLAYMVWMRSQRGQPLGFTALVAVLLMFATLAITPWFVLLVYLGYGVYYGIQRRRAKLAYRADPTPRSAGDHHSMLSTTS